MLSRRWLATLVTLALLTAPATAQDRGERSAALDELGRGTAAFRAGDIVAATQHWSEAVRVCRHRGNSLLSDRPHRAARGPAPRYPGRRSVGRRAPPPTSASLPRRCPRRGTLPSRVPSRRARRSGPCRPPRAPGRRAQRTPPVFRPRQRIDSIVCGSCHTGPRVRAPRGPRTGSGRCLSAE